MFAVKMISFISKNNTLKRSLAVAKLLVIVCFWACTTLFVHPHLVDGQVIYHSHPYASTTHAHAMAEMVAIGALTMLAVAVAGFIGADLFSEGVTLVRRYDSKFIVKFSGVARSLRAPPVEVTAFR